MKIEEIEKMLVQDKEWQYMGEVDSRKRPANSLLNKTELKWDVIEQIETISAKQNSEIQKMTLQRLRERTFDNYNYSAQYVEEEEEQMDTIEDEEHTNIEELYNEIEGDLLAISDFRYFAYNPDLEIKKVKKIENKEKKKLKAKSLGNIKNVTIIK